MSEKVSNSCNWVALVTIITNAIVEIIKLLFNC